MNENATDDNFFQSYETEKNYIKSYREKEMNLDQQFYDNKIMEMP